uniref:Uncharacterized protein n=1 Tax=Strongyloides stercoralis TaxID=6248 RepID=A0A0K0E5U5_STRER
MLIMIRNPGMFFCFDLLRYNLEISIVVLEAVVQLELNLKHGSSSVRVESCCSTGAESEA